jgi:hypothetical protein
MAPPAAAIPFGTDLNRPPSLAAGFCPDYLYSTPGAPAGQSCAWESVNFQTGENPFPPVGLGVVTRVRVRVGGSTGPMQVVVLRGLRTSNTPGGIILDPNDPEQKRQIFTPGSAGYSCCKAIGLSQVFVPVPGTITAIDVNLPTRNDIAPDPTTGVYVGDFLALQVLRPDVRIPMAADPNFITGGFFPAWQLNEERASIYGITGGGVLLNADWNPTPARGDVIPGFGPIRFTNGVLPVRVPGPGILRVTDARLGRAAANAAALAHAAKKSRRRSRIKPVRLTVTRQGTVRVKIRPSNTGRRTLRRKGKLNLKLLLTFTPAGSPSSATATAKVTLKLRKARRR